MNNKIDHYQYAITNVDHASSIISRLIVWEIIYNKDKPTEFFLTNPRKVAKMFIFRQFRLKKFVTTVHISNLNIIEHYMNGILFENKGTFPNVRIQNSKKGIKYIKTEINDNDEDNLGSLPKCNFL
jgi:hypothetical protein